MMKKVELKKDNPTGQTMLVEEIEGLEFHFKSLFNDAASGDGFYNFDVSFHLLNSESEPFKLLAHCIQIWDGDEELISTDHQRIPTEEQTIQNNEAVELDVGCDLNYPCGEIQFAFDVIRDGKTVRLESPKYLLKATQFFH